MRNDVDSGNRMGGGREIFFSRLSRLSKASMEKLVDMIIIMCVCKDETCIALNIQKESEKKDSMISDWSTSPIG